MIAYHIVCTRPRILCYCSYSRRLDSSTAVLITFSIPRLYFYHYLFCTPLQTALQDAIYEQAKAEMAAAAKGSFSDTNVSFSLV
jgi:hypothetical protein